MDLATSNLSALGMMAPWVALPSVRMEQWIVDNRDWEASRVRHRRLP
jgi:hypothetical protein